jgi:hypothetical protein
MGVDKTNEEMFNDTSAKIVVIDSSLIMDLKEVELVQKQ